MADARCVEVLRFVSGNIEEEVLGSHLKPVRGRSGQREIAVGPFNGTGFEAACSFSTAQAVGAVPDGQNKVFEHLSRATHFHDRSGIEHGLEGAVRTSDDVGNSCWVKLYRDVSPDPHGALRVCSKMRLGPLKDCGDGVFTSTEVHRRWYGGAPCSVGTCGGGEQGGAVELDLEVKPNQTVSVNRVKVVQTPTEFPCVAACCVNAVFEKERNPRAVGEEEGDVSFTASIEPLRCNFRKQRSVAKVEDVWNDPIKGVISVCIGVQRGDDDAFNHELDLMVGYPDELVVNHRTRDGYGLIDGHR